MDRYTASPVNFPPLFFLFMIIRVLLYLKFFSKDVPVSLSEYAGNVSIRVEPKSVYTNEAGEIYDSISCTVSLKTQLAGTSARVHVLKHVLSTLETDGKN